MLKLLLVDDEKIILKGLELTYDWERMGYQVAGTASSGEEALRMIQEKDIDAVLSDIQMNGMSGLELIKKGREIKENLMFVMISAHKEFEYAKAACDQGAFSYLLKPLEEEKLEEVMKSMREKIIEVSRVQRESNVWRELLMNNRNGFQEMLLEKYLQNILSEEKFTYIMNLIGCELTPTSCFTAVCADFDIGYKVIEQVQYEMYRFKLFRDMIELLEKEYDLWGICSDRNLLFVLRLHPGQDIKEIPGLIENMQKEKEYTIISAVTPVYAGGAGLRQACIQAEHLFEIASEAGAVMLVSEEAERISQSADTYSEHAEQFVINAIRSNNLEKLKESYKRYIGLLPMDKEEQYLRICLHHLAVNVAFMLENSYGMTGEIKKMIDSFYESYPRLMASKMVDVLYQLFVKMISVRRENQSETVHTYLNGYIEKAKAYIKENLSDPELSIGDVAEAIFLNPVYFGRIFKNTCGVSFKRYLLNCRMELAKKLLQEEYSIGVICEKVGIWNPSYFSQLFKQTIGCLPSEYRKNTKETDKL